MMDNPPSSSLLTKDWVGLVEYEREEFAEELVGEGDHGAESESAAESHEQKDLRGSDNTRVKLTIIDYPKSDSISGHDRSLDQDLSHCAEIVLQSCVKVER